ncbi:hypothetical protein [Pedobacter nyackensis]|uniref:Uncharacterized protein n=1 Tax=Pedobacter nyackensis TaxID=475255 RepID=A0A1W2A076_9SPHI|nr:hypothetical protein [Pedobacter nyackensis]SMC54033.1 hypothetical protein SAMN04488101_101210 [Pedobacter nyackensis]
MRNFIKALYADLLHRIDVVVADINSIQHHDDIKDRFITDTLKQFADIRDVLQDAFDTGVLEYDEFTGNNLYLFNKANREFNAIHSYRYLAIKNYKKPEIFFFRLITQIYNEHRINALPPIVSTISNHDYYYWAVPYFEIIALPSGEENSLLNLPDMYHEIGHLMHSMFRGGSSEQSAKIIDKYFASEIVRVEDEGLGEHFKGPLEDARHLWAASWLEEFSCDLVGTYMTGGAYAWTNLKLLSTGHGSSKIFESSESHPADEARMEIILMMLEKLGLDAEKAKVERSWKSFLKDTEVFRPSIHKMIFPKKLLQQIVDEFFEFYQNADLASYTELSALGQGSISEILNEAWATAQADPLQYFAYETGKILDIRDSFGLKDNVAEVA